MFSALGKSESSKRSMGTAPHIKGRFSSQLNRFSQSMHWLPEKHQSGSTWPPMPTGKQSAA
jgi:hypothetical protein